VEVYYANTPLLSYDLQIIQYGREQCVPGHGFGPCIRNGFLIHYICKGKGRFETENKIYHLKEGQMFLIFPGQVTYYEADRKNPWMYCWVEFSGNYSEQLMNRAGMHRNMPVQSFANKEAVEGAFHEMINLGNTRFEELMSKFWNLINELTRSYQNPIERSLQEEYVKYTEDYIRANLRNKISINEIASHIGINRSYLSRLFKKYKNASPQQFIVETKMYTASMLLKNSDKSISEIAQLVGYCDRFEFSKKFKRFFGVSPSVWKKQEFWEHSVRHLKNN